MGRHAGLGGRRRATPTLAGAATVLVGALLIAAPPPYRSAVRGTGTLAGGALAAADAPGPAGGAAPIGPTSSSAPRRTPAGGTPSGGPPPGQVTFSFAGDVHFAGRTAGLATAGAGMLGPVGTVLGAADIAMLNLESAITERGTAEPKQFHFRAPPVVLDTLRQAGLDVVTMANNHAVDYGPVGLRDTLDAIGAHRLPVVGIGADAAHAYAPWYATVRGTRVAVIAASQVHDRTLAAWTAGEHSPGIASATSPRLLAAVREARKRASIVVVYLHWGTEGDACPNGEQRTVAAELAAVGADAVVGTHAHLLLGAGFLGSTFVDYGLGNFVWWLDNAYSNDTGVLTLTFRDRHLVRRSFTAAVIDRAGLPLPASRPATARILGKLEHGRECAGLSGQATG